MIDERDRVLPLDDLPQSSVGAPCPLVIQDEHTAVIGCVVLEDGEAEDGSEN